MAQDLTAFFVENTLDTENVKFVASKRYIDPKTKKPIEWEIRAISTELDEAIRKDCTKRVPVPGKRGQYTNETNMTEYLGRLCAECTVYPNLNDAALQDNRKVKTADKLLKAMLNAGEYAEYQAKVAEINGFDLSMEDRVEEAKN